MTSNWRAHLLLLLLPLLGSGCGIRMGLARQTPAPTAQSAALVITAVAATTTTPMATVALVSPTSPPQPTTTPTPQATATLPPTTTPFATPTPSATPFPPFYCARPPDDYSRVTVEGHMLNARTLAMLHNAQQLYPGPGDLLRITQGSYRDANPSSFGTHDGGGAVDISIRDQRQPGVFLWDEAESMVGALRAAGFAAWYRYPDALGPGSAAHIHAIAVGDAELSDAAYEQVYGPGGYLNDMDGLIPPWGPNPDPHGGPIVCPWMTSS